MRNKYFLGFLSFLLFTWIFLNSIWLNFSTEKLNSFIQSEINARLKGGSVQVHLEKTSPVYLGIELEDIEVTSNFGEPLVTIDSLNINISVMSLLFQQGIPYELEISGGTVEGWINLYPERSIIFKAERIPINRIPIVRKTDLILSNALLNMEGKFALDPKTTKGELSAKISNLTLSGDAKLTNLQFTLPDISFASLTAKMKISQRNLVLQSVRSQGDVNVKSSGSVLLNMGRPRNSEADIEVEGDIDAEYMKKLGDLGALISGMYLKPNGDIKLKIQGRMSAPQINKI